MYKIMFVCHGNICRSPMAEFIFKKLLEEHGLSDDFEVASAATSTEEIGNPVYPPARRELARHGIDCAGKRAVQLRRDDYRKYDLFICMDKRNMRNMQRIFEGDPDGKLHMLLDFTASGGEVDDPWYTGDFEETYRCIDEGCRALLERLTEKA